MSEDNLARMIALAEEFFDMKNDPDQLSVDSRTMARLREIHPGTMSEESDEHGPIAWMLVIPTTGALMEEFVRGRINERELLERTRPGMSYDALYLCSALVLPEYRRKGLAARLASRALRSIMKDHPIRSLFYWGFSPAGRALATGVARDFNLPLLAREA
ncbi:MAG TPA: GNAT family N-acetyltransferase [Bacteroidota bacterium]|nr:GNAT family N-acetyltransferase [Bacteroidota bacterium]